MLTILVSSTFNDMQAERDAIHTVVAPKIRRIAASYGESVRLLDLRWGVNTEAMSEDAAAGKVLDVCLDEIDRCDGYMVCILGNRYGWVPDYSRVDSLERHGIVLDQPCSVTELEIRYGILERNQGEKAIVFFRDEVTNLPDDLITKYQDPEEDKRQQELKQKLQALPGCKCHHYSLRYQSEEEFEGIEYFCEELIQSLTALLERQYAQMVPQSEFQRRERLFSGVISICSDGYMPVPEAEAALDCFFQSRNRFLVVYGDAGMGKTSLAARVCNRPPSDFLVIPYFCSVAGVRTVQEDILRYFMERLSILMGEEFPKEQSVSDLVDVFSDMLSRCKHKICFVVDGLEHLDCPEEKSLTWLPNIMPEHIRMMITTKPGHTACLQLEELWRVQKLLIEPLKEPEQFICGLLLQQGKELPKTLLARISDSPLSGNYLYNAMVVRILMLLNRKDFAAINQQGGSIEVINAYLAGKLENLPDSMERMGFLLMHECGEQIAPGMTVPLLGAIAASPIGLRSQDLEQLFPDIWDELMFCRLTAFLDGYLEDDDRGFYQFTRPFLKKVFLQLATEEIFEKLAGYIMGLDLQEPLLLACGLIFFVNRGAMKKAQTLLRAHPDSDALVEQFIFCMAQGLSAKLRAVLQDETVFLWFLEKVLPELTEATHLSDAIRLLQNLIFPDAAELSIRQLKALGELAQKSNRERVAYDAYRQLLLLAEQSGDLFLLADCQRSLLIHMFVEDNKELCEFEQLLDDTLQIYEAQKELNPDDTLKFLSCRIYRTILTAQECFGKIQGGATSAYDVIHHTNTAETAMPYCETLLLIGLHEIAGNPPSQEVVGALEELCRLCEILLGYLYDKNWQGNRTQCRELILLCYQAMMRADTPENPLNTSAFSEDAKRRYQCFLIRRIKLMAQTVVELQADLRKSYQLSGMKQLASVKLHLAAINPEPDEKLQDLEHGCQIYERYFNRYTLPEFAGDLEIALRDLAGCYLEKKNYPAYEDALMRWSGVKISICQEKIKRALELCKRYPDEEHREQLLRARASLKGVWEEYAMRLCLREDYHFQTTMDTIFASVQFCRRKKIKHDRDMVKKELFYYEIRLAMDLLEKMEQCTDALEKSRWQVTYRETMQKAYKLLMIAQTEEVPEERGKIYYEIAFAFLERFVSLVSEHMDFYRRADLMGATASLAEIGKKRLEYEPENDALFYEVLDITEALLHELQDQTVYPASWYKNEVSRYTVLMLRCGVLMQRTEALYQNRDFSAAADFGEKLLDTAIALGQEAEVRELAVAASKELALFGARMLLSCYEQLGEFQKMDFVIKRLNRL